MKAICSIFVAGISMMCLAAPVAELTKSSTSPHKIALVVQNHCPPGAKFPTGALTDALTARLSGKCFQVINPYNAVGVTENRTAAGEPLPKMSAIELAQGLGAEGVVTASVIEFLDTTIGNPPVLHQYVVRLVLNLADASTGAVVCGETIKVRSRQYTIAQDRTNRLAYIDDLMYLAADQCAELLKEKAADWRPASLPPPVVSTTHEKKDVDDFVDLGRKEPVSPQDKLKPRREVPTDPDFTMSDFDLMFESLVKSMLDNPRFKENYEAAQTEKGGLPIVIIGLVSNKSDGTASQSYGELLKAIPDALRIELFNSNLFDVKNDELSVMFAQRILASDKSPVEDGELMSSLKRHGSPDFVIVGDIRLFVDHGKRKTCRVHLALHSLKTGKVVWEGKKTAIK